ncbi:MAG: 4-fold beta flower protein [Candidatus Levyibacteriota bacterium]
MREIDVIYNRYGHPMFRLFGNGRIVTFQGKSAGFIKGDSLYNYEGKHVGWYSDGLIRDHQGLVVGFGQRVTDGIKPFLPFKQFKPFPSPLEFEPFRPFTEFEPFRPFKSFYWSDIELESLFK